MCQKVPRIKQLHGVLPDKQLANGTTGEVIPGQLVERMGPRGKDRFTDVSVVCPVAPSYTRAGAQEHITCTCI